MMLYMKCGCKITRPDWLKNVYSTVLQCKYYLMLYIRVYCFIQIFCYWKQCNRSPSSSFFMSFIAYAFTAYEDLKWVHFNETSVPSVQILQFFKVELLCVLFLLMSLPTYSASKFCMHQEVVRAARCPTSYTNIQGAGCSSSFYWLVIDLIAS